jgi:hypothetical protein
MDAPPAKRQMIHPQFQTQTQSQTQARTAFKQLTMVKDNPELVHNWFYTTDEQSLKLAGAYGLHILLSSDHPYLIRSAFQRMAIDYETVDNPELAILTVQYLTMEGTPECMEQAYRLTARMTSQSEPLARKRIVEILLDACYRKMDYEAAVGIINTFLRGVPFNADGDNLAPMRMAPAELRRHVFLWFIGQEIYLPADTPWTRDPPSSLRVIPMDLSEVHSELIKRLPMKGGLPACTMLDISCKYIIDGANVLFSGGEQLLHSIVGQLRTQGSVAVVLHKRHQINFTLDPRVTFIRTPYGVNDDYYSLALAIKESRYLVTNDQFRDHVYQISPLIKRWQKTAVIRFSLNGDLKMPPPYSHCIQATDEGVFVPTENPMLWLQV